MAEIIKIWEVRDYVSKKTNKQMFSFNAGQFHLSYLQLQNAGVPVPQLLQDTEMRVEFYEVGEVLLNGNTVTDPKKIVKNFTPEIDKDLYRQVALDKLKAKVSMWDSVTARTAGNTAGGLNPGIAPNANTNINTNTPNNTSVTTAPQPETPQVTLTPEQIAAAQAATGNPDVTANAENLTNASLGG